MAKSMFDIIKKQNGESFAKSIRSFDSRIFNIKDFSQIVKYAGRDAEPILFFLQSLVEVDEKQEVLEVKNPIDLLKEAGYNAFVVNTEDEKNSIEKYFYVNPVASLDERICTLRDSHRHEKYHIVHAIKEGAENLNRLDFKMPERQDEYGTSVISIQMRKSGGHVSIKNRYNHTVADCDNTFGSNPDNIISGLSDSLQYYFNVDFSGPKQNVPDGFTYQNRVLYKYLYECDNVYFAESSYLKEGRVVPLNKDYQFLVGTYVVDLKEKKITNVAKENDPYDLLLTNEMQGSKVRKDLKEGKIQLFVDGKLFFEVDENGIVRKICLQKAEELPDSPFRHLLSEIEELNAPNLKKLGSYTCSSDKFKVLIAPKLEEVGNHCLFFCPLMEKLILPELKKVGNRSIAYLNGIKELYFPKLETVGNESFSSLDTVKSMSLPMLHTVGEYSFTYNKSQEKLLLPQLKKLGAGSILKLNSLKSLYLPNLEEMGYQAVCENPMLQKIVLPKLKKTGVVCLCENAAGFSVEAPCLETVGKGSLSDVGSYIGPKFNWAESEKEALKKRHIYNKLYPEKKVSRSVFQGVFCWFKDLFVHQR